MCLVGFVLVRLPWPCSIFCPRLARETFVARDPRIGVPDYAPLSPTQAGQAQEADIRWQAVPGCKHKLAFMPPKRCNNWYFAVFGSRNQAISAWWWYSRRSAVAISPGAPLPTGLPSMLTTGSTIWLAEVMKASRAA